MNLDMFWQDDVINEWLVNGLRSQLKFYPLLTGTGPWGEQVFCEFLCRCGIDATSYQMEPCLGSDIVVGRYNYDFGAILECIELRDAFVGPMDGPGRTRIYSQEMAYLYVLTGKDPFDAPHEVLRRFGAGHEALERLMHEGFKWPTTFVGENTTPWDTNNEIGYDTGLPQTGIFKLMGYKVGMTGIQEASRRQAILRTVFTSNLNTEANRQFYEPEYPYYISEWGSASSSQRLEKMANSIAGNINRAQRNPNDMELAIEHWEADLDWLRQTYYVGRFDFAWPYIDGW